MKIPKRSGFRPVLLEIAVFPSFLLAAVSPVAVGQDKTAVAISILERLDTNRDGKLEPHEIPDGSRAAVERVVAEAGLSGKSSISISKLRKKLEKDKKEGDAKSKKEERERQERAPSKSNMPSSTRNSSGFGSSSDARPKSKTATPGFGAKSGSAKDPKVKKYVDDLFKNSDKNRNNYIDQKEIGTVRARNVKEWDTNKDGKISRSEVTAYISSGGNSRSRRSTEEAKKSSSFGTRTTSTSAKSKSSSSGYQDRYKRYADGLIKRYDANKNGYLEKNKDEWSRISFAEEADKSGDGILTLDELANHSRNASNSAKSSKTKSTTKTERPTSRDERRRDDRSRSERRSRDRDDKKKSSSGERRSYRMSSAHDRLPSGLPEWFTDKDDNENGQIEMFEYTSSWSDRKVKEFGKYDTNNDGVITPTECLDND